ncbi:MAG: transposase [Acidimicrobiales bacterium]
MPRQPRKNRAGTFHHLTNRGARRLPVFGDAEDRGFFMWILSEFGERFDVEIHAYCLMTNHYHLLAGGSVDQLSEAMHRLGTLYTRHFNDRNGFDGPLFRGRYYSNPICDDDYFRNAVRYIHRNPDAINSAEPLASYRWSSHAIYLGRRPAGWVRTDRTMDLFGGSRQTYREFVDAEDSLSRSDVVRCVADVSGTAPEQLLVRTRGSSNRAARVLILLLREVAGESIPDLAELLEMKPGSLRAALSKARGSLEHDPDLARLYAEAKAALGPVPSVVFERS